jgi:hypothetical protein
MKEIVDPKGTKILDVSTMLVEFNGKLGCNGREIDRESVSRRQAANTKN